MSEKPPTLDYEQPALKRPPSALARLLILMGLGVGLVIAGAYIINFLHH